MRWSPTMEVARPHALCFHGGDCEAACKRSRSGDITLSVEYDVAATLRRRIPHGGDLLSAVRSVSLNSLST